MLTRKARSQAKQTAKPDGPPSELVVRLKERHLRWTSLEEVVNYIRDNELRGYCRIRFDFSRVNELIGPWGVHFAILIRLEHQAGVPVMVSGLTGQPADLARLFRSSPHVRALLTGHGPRPGDEGTDRQAA
ncbi:MAG: hypothetical protein ACE5GE_12265 [Phycisphaerae bacterium]